MKTEEEIREAHDIIIAVIEGSTIEEIHKRAMHAACDALCFVLECQNNLTFENNLTNLRNLMEAQGVKLVKYTSHPE